MDIPPKQILFKSAWKKIFGWS